MAKKMIDPTLDTAHKIANNMGKTALKYREKSPFDKTYNAVILGVNQKFIKDITDGDKSDVIVKYAIPEAVDEGENSYYTFKINGAYYCKRQNGSFKLYDDIMVYIPNGDWSRMYFDYADGASHFEGNSTSGNIEESQWWVSADAPGGNLFKTGDLWIVVNNPTITNFTNVTTKNYVKIYQYNADDNDITGYHYLDCSIGRSYTGDISTLSVGDIYIQTTLSGKFKRILQCTAIEGTTVTWLEIYPDSDTEYTPNVTISNQKPMGIGDHWIDVDTDETINAEALWEYIYDSSAKKQRWERLCLFSAGTSHTLYSQPDEPEDINIKTDDLWIETTSVESPVAEALYKYQYNSQTDENEWVRLNTFAGGGSGVGEWLDDEHTTERFNDYGQTRYSDGNTSNMKFTHLEGYENKATATVGTDFQYSSYSHIEGYYNTITYSTNTFAVHVEGYNNKAIDCDSAFVGGRSNTATKFTAGIVTGEANTINDCSHSVVVGMDNNVANTGRSLVVGQDNTARYCSCQLIGGDHVADYGGYRGITFGDHVTVGTLNGSSTSGGNQHGLVIGQNITVRGTANSSVVSGRDHQLTGASAAGIFGVGHTGSFSNAVVAGWYAHGDSGAIVVGNGSSNDPYNTFYVTNSGGVYAAGGYNAIGADYAEYFEWADGNPDNDDRCGMLVMLSGDKIVPAHGDNILGAISARASVVGNAFEEHWHGKYITDVYGRSNGELSPEYDPERKYVPRSQRSEWDAVGLVGRLIIRDDGECQIGSGVVAQDGIAIPCSDRKTNVRMLKRIDKTHIEVLIK